MIYEHFFCLLYGMIKTREEKIEKRWLAINQFLFYENEEFLSTLVEWQKIHIQVWKDFFARFDQETETL